MKIPEKAPEWYEIYQTLDTEGRNKVFLSFPDDYRHWDELKYRSPPEGLTREQWWCSLKFKRSSSLKPLPLRDRQGKPFRFSVPDSVARQLHQIDLSAGGRIGIPEAVTNPDTRDQYLIRSLMDEAITSSQLEGAVTTRDVATQMLRTGRQPRDKSEQMILNNYQTMRHIRELKSPKLTPEIVLAIHTMVTRDTLDKPDGAGRLRRFDEIITVEDNEDNVIHIPPSALELETRMKLMCDFANGEPVEPFIHPAIRAIILHFWLAYDHPFIDGNGRTARALFYWAMLRADYWLFEYISISDILKRAPVKYYRAFLHSETDDNDLTYFLLHQADVIRKAIAKLNEYISRKTKEVRESEKFLRNWRQLNHRQQAIVGNALRHPGAVYTVEGHQTSQNTAYETARKDLLGLVQEGLLEKRTSGRKMLFYPSATLEASILNGGTAGEV
jgi:Fic family protein